MARRFARPLRVAICEPQLRSWGLPYLPVMWGVLKTHFETHDDATAVRWCPPIHRMENPDSIAAALLLAFDGNGPDVLGLSCYVWNWRLQREVAARVRAAAPGCLIVAGGPHPDHANPLFFKQNPFLDVVVVKDGEKPFTRILQRLLESESMEAFRAAGAPLDDIPGLVLPSRPGHLTAPPQLADDFAISHYLAQKPYYDAFFAEHEGGVAVAWESSRGCPFSCTYCDWGSSTMSRVRRFPMDRLLEEVDWFARSGVKVLFSVDSNFGMFKTDVDLTDALVKARQAHSAPGFFVYSNAKNVPGRTVDITRKLISAGLEAVHTLSVQHTDPAVLEAADRKNISVPKQMQVVKSLQADGIPINVQLILGLPEDTPARWRKTFADLFAWGVHDGHTVTPYHLLPNAPAAAPKHRQRFAIRTVERYIYDGEGHRPIQAPDPLADARGEVVVGTSSFSGDDWVTMATEAATLQALHNGGLTQMVARYARAACAIGYDAFYDCVLDEVLPSEPALAAAVAEVAACFRSFLEADTGPAMLSLPADIDFPDAKRETPPNRWLFAVFARHLEELHAALERGLAERFPRMPRLASALAYQRALQVLPTFDPAVGARVPIDHDWPAWFAGPAAHEPADRAETSDEPDKPDKAAKAARAATVPGPAACPGATLHIRDTGWNDLAGSDEFRWTPGNGGASWGRWFNQIACGRTSARRCLFQAVEVEPAEAPAC